MRPKHAEISLQSDYDGPEIFFLNAHYPPKAPEKRTENRSTAAGSVQPSYAAVHVPTVKPGRANAVGVLIAKRTQQLNLEISKNSWPRVRGSEPGACPVPSAPTPCRVRDTARACWPVAPVELDLHGRATTARVRMAASLLAHTLRARRLVPAFSQRGARPRRAAVTAPGSGGGSSR